LFFIYSKLLLHHYFCLLKELFEIQTKNKSDIDQHVNTIDMILVTHTCARSLDAGRNGTRMLNMLVHSRGAAVGQNIVEFDVDEERH
jgi:hypothetical protein